MIYISLDNFREINVNIPFFWFIDLIIYWMQVLILRTRTCKRKLIAFCNLILFFPKWILIFFSYFLHFFFFFQNQNSVPGFQDLVTVQCAASLIHMLVLLLLHKNFRFHPNLTTMKFSMKWHGTLTKEANQRIEKKITSRILATLSLLLFS